MFLVTVHDPICTEDGDLAAALYGSFLPTPFPDAFPPTDPADFAREKVAGAIVARKERIVINQGRERIKLRVTNNGDRPIQVRASCASPRNHLTPFPDRLTLPLYRDEQGAVVRPR